jgi:hypothetical protein
MFKNIGSKIKVIAWIIFITCVLVGGVMFLTSYSDNSRHIESYGTASIEAQANIVYSMIIVVSGVISSFLCYGFGEIIDSLSSIITMLYEKQQAEEPNTNESNRIEMND